jgi:hypothetical protein
MATYPDAIASSSAVYIPDTRIGGSPGFSILRREV